MSKFKVGDRVLFLEKDSSFEENLKIGNYYTVVQLWLPHYWLINDVGKKTFVDESQIKLISELYKNSNRYKLKQAIKETGFYAENLSLETGHAKTYFTGFTAESRFNSRGDITEDRLNSLLTTLAFAERKLLELAPKTVDENNVPMVEKSIDESVVETKSDLDSFLIDNETWFLEDNEIKDNKSKKFLIVFVLLVIILTVYFFTR
jgi:hypothetical protein